MSADQQRDIDMESQQEPEAVEESQGKKLTVSRNPPEDMTSATYSFVGEDHTLGNLVRNQIVKNKHVEFCAYSVPHPSEAICNVRIQLSETSADGPNAVDTDKVLKASLKRVSRVCDALTEKFQARLAEFKASQQHANADSQEMSD